MTRSLVRGALTAALYAVLTYVFGRLSYGVPLGPFLIDIRPSEALTVLPIFFSEAVPGLFVGTLLANLLGGLGPWDIFGGSAVTLLAAWVTHRLAGRLGSYLSPVVLNGLIISLYLSAIFHLPYWPTVVSIALGEGLVVFALGWPLARLLQQRGFKPAASRLRSTKAPA